MLYYCILSVDIKALKTYQQVYLYFAPILTNLGFINIIVVIIRIHWFDKHIRKMSKTYLIFYIRHAFIRISGLMIT